MTAAEKRALVPANLAPTLRQLRVLQYIEDYRAKHEYGPTVREIGDALDIASTNAVFDHLRPLRRKGLLTEARLMTGTAIGRTLKATELGLKWLASLTPAEEEA